MRLQLEARQGRHLKEIAEEISANRFLEQRELEILICDGVEQMSAHHRLMEVRCHLGYEERVICINEGLISPRKIRMHRVTQLMGEGAHAGHFIRVAHVDEGMSSLHAPRKRAFGFAHVRVHVHPAILEAAAADSFHIVFAQG